MTIPWRRLTTRIGILCFLAVWLQTASAGPVPFGSAVSGQRGDPVAATLFDSVINFEAADIRLTFDPVFLTFMGVAGGTLTSGFSVLAGTPRATTGPLQEVLISIATLGAGVTGDPPQSLLIASFLINNSAPFDTTSVVFAPRQDLGPPVYDFAPTAAQITVLGSNSVPIGNTGVLVLTGLAAIFSLRRATCVAPLSAKKTRT